MAIDTGHLHLVATDDVIRVTLRVMVKGPCSSMCTAILRFTFGAASASGSPGKVSSTWGAHAQAGGTRKSGRKRCSASGACGRSSFRGRPLPRPSLYAR
ncbi:MAG: hypothetical protein [Olavius algarvensis Gamma 1 endosymbiont]|nr:MAG: hypothetical protein [Olavius algarvensis Gamma 1 endosymbiont]